MRELLKRMEEGEFNPGAAKRDVGIAATLLKSASEHIAVDKARGIGGVGAALSTIRDMMKRMGPQYKKAVVALDKAILELIKSADEDQG